MENNCKVAILRYAPIAGREFKFDTFEEVPCKDLTVLNVLDYIYKERDSSLAYRGRLCTKGYCGGCGILVNGRPCLPCQTLAEQEMTLEPHPGYKVIKDLVCDWEHLDDDPSRLKRIKKPYPGIFVNPEKCVNCGDCVLICPVKVYEILDGKVTIAHNERCLGRSCQLCSDACWKTAIFVKD